MEVSHELWPATELFQTETTLWPPSLSIPSILIPTLVFDRGVRFMPGLLVRMLLTYVHLECMFAREVLTTHGAGAAYSQNLCDFR